MTEPEAPLWRLVRDAMVRPADANRLDQVDDQLLDRLAPLFRDACRSYYGLTLRGMEKVPEGPALVVGNHNSGITFIEALGWGSWVHTLRPHERWHALAHDGIVGMPGLGNFLVRGGALRAHPDVTMAALRDGRKIVVFPGGNLEAFRPWSRRGEIDFGGRTGWVKVAVRAGVPIVPLVFQGGHNGFFVVSDNRWLARALRLDRLLRVNTWPLVIGLPWGVSLGPWFHLPLPVKVRTRFLDPIPTAHLGPAAAEDPVVLRDLYATVTSRMQAALNETA